MPSPNFKIRTLFLFNFVNIFRHELCHHQDSWRYITKLLKDFLSIFEKFLGMNNSKIFVESSPQQVTLVDELLLPHLPHKHIAGKDLLHRSKNNIRHRMTWWLKVFTNRYICSLVTQLHYSIPVSCESFLCSVTSLSSILHTIFLAGDHIQ